MKKDDKGGFGLGWLQRHGEDPGPLGAVARAAMKWKCCTWTKRNKCGFCWGIVGEMLAMHFRNLHPRFSLEAYLKLREMYEAEKVGRM